MRTLSWKSEDCLKFLGRNFEGGPLPSPNQSGNGGDALTRPGYSIGDLEVDTGVREVRRNGFLIPLPRLSFDLLLTLARHAPNLVTIYELEQDVWPGLVVSPATVSKRVALLRAALGDDAEAPTYISVVRGKGYRLLAPVRAHGKEKPGGLPQRSDDLPKHLKGWLTGLVVAVIIAAATVAGLHRTGLIDLGTGTSMSSSNAVKNSNRAMPDELQTQQSVAVLPFLSLSDSEDDQYLADGIAEEIINRLAAIDSLRVVARTSSFTFRGQEETVDEIARQLHATHIVEGSVQFQNEHIRATIQLIDARSGLHIWSKKFDHPFADIFEIQDSIAASVASAFDRQIGGVGSGDPDAQLTDNPEAYAHYLRGRALLHKRLELQSPVIDASIAAFRAATQLDPEFADAWAGLSKAWWLRSVPDRNQNEKQEWAASAAFTALELDPDNPGANAVLGAMHWRSGFFQRAKHNFDIALRQPVLDSDIRLWAGVLMDSVGYSNDAYTLYERANRLDPLNQSVITFLSNSLVIRGEPQKAAHLLSNQIEHEWQELHLGKIALITGHSDKARNYLSNLRLPIGTLPERFVELVIQAVNDETPAYLAEKPILQAVDAGELNNETAYQLFWLMGSAALFEVSSHKPAGLLALQISTNAWASEDSTFRRDQRFHDWAFDVGLVEFWNSNAWPRQCQSTSDTSFVCW
jgi:TolB-like protein/DNA-binding winged helix-turn-helix (wHTH) protein/tetratricopeptide (TPR) repeat protein